MLLEKVTLVFLSRTYYIFIIIYNFMYEYVTYYDVFKDSTT